MKKLATLTMAILFAAVSFAQDIAGQWNGILKFQGMQLRLVFNITKTESGFSATMDSPDQGANGIPVTTVSFEQATLKITVENAKIAYEGVIGSDNIITGNFKQSGQSFPLNLSREKIEKKKVLRPQEPQKPYPYYTEEVTFDNKEAGIKLAGTLTLPDKNGIFPVVVLITGSGPQNRDEELLGHKPFLVLADYLTNNGFAVLRYDDRGVASSKGVFKTATTADFSTDAAAAVEYLKTRKEINKKKIGMIGHSEGGLIAPMVASKSKDIAFIVLLAGPGLPGGALLLLQEQLIGRASGMSEGKIKEGIVANKRIFDIVANAKNDDQLKKELTSFLKTQLKESEDGTKPAGMSDDDFVNATISRIATPWMEYFIKYDPITALEKVKCPVLAINGAKDLQVPPKEDLNPIKNAVAKGGNKNVTIKELPGLNHLFQECTTGSPDEYAEIEQTFSPIALKEIGDWLKLQTK